jgi:predicted AlkP superfamily phosphohydrolase/phosphomutase
MQSDMNPLLVVGFDGMTWDAADKIAMPNLEALIERGGRSSLQSTYPPVTCPAWPSYLTGKKPGKHGAYDFARLSKSGDVDLTSYQDLTSPTLIDVMNQLEVPSLFFEIPVTFPAPEGTADVIAGYPAELNDQKFSDPDLRKTLEEELGDFPPISPNRYTGHNQQEVEEQFFDTTRYRGDAFRNLLANREWQFATINFHLPDQFAHYFWDQFENHPGSSPLTRAYRLVDDLLGDIIATVPDSTNVMVISDHGQGPQAATVNLNYALMREGFLKLKSSFTTKIKRWMFQYGLNPAKIKSLLDTLNLTRFLSLLDRESRDEILNKFLSFKDVDFESTDAFAFGHMGQIYWLGNGDQSPEQLKQSLRTVTDGEESLEIETFIELRDGTEPSFEKPKWLVKMNGWSDIAYPLFLGEWGLKQPSSYAGCHRPEGILAWAGPDLTTEEPEEPSLYDLAPTIHRLLELPPQPDFDGRVLEELLAEDAPDARSAKDYTTDNTTQSGDDEERIEQLKNLGYL